MGGIPAGRRNRLVSLVRYGVTYDAHNQPIQSWTEYESDLWSSWRRATANEQLAAGQVGAQVTDIFEMTWTPTVAAADPKDRLIFDGRTYDIVEVTEIGFREGLLIRAAAKADITIVIPGSLPMLDFSIAANSMYVPLLFEDF